jgi:crotonobetainyl-CoA:carnitine CoA-transferase CaiB-like acyl-CoA transferase
VDIAGYLATGQASACWAPPIGWPPYLAFDCNDGDTPVVGAGAAISIMRLCRSSRPPDALSDREQAGGNEHGADEQGVE